MHAVTLHDQVIARSPRQSHGHADIVETEGERRQNYLQIARCDDRLRINRSAAAAAAVSIESGGAQRVKYSWKFQQTLVRGNDEHLTNDLLITGDVDRVIWEMKSVFTSDIERPMIVKSESNLIINVHRASRGGREGCSDLEKQKIAQVFHIARWTIELM